MPQEDLRKFGKANWKGVRYLSKCFGSRGQGCLAVSKRCVIAFWLRGEHGLTIAISDSIVRLLGGNLFPIQTWFPSLESQRHCSHFVS